MSCGPTTPAWSGAWSAPSNGPRGRRVRPRRPRRTGPWPPGWPPRRPPPGPERAGPASSLVVAVRRGADTFTPNGQTELRRGDRLTILVPAPQADALAEAVAT